MSTIYLTPCYLVVVSLLISCSYTNKSASESIIQSSTPVSLFNEEDYDAKKASALKPIADVNSYDDYAQLVTTNELMNHPAEAVGLLVSSIGSCTASVVDRRDLIVTAGHCVYDGNKRKKAENIRFYRAYPIGEQKPYLGKIIDFASGYPQEIDRSMAGNGKITDKAVSLDLAFIELDRDIPDRIRPLKGIRYSKTYCKASWTSYGYPAKAPFPGGKMFRTPARTSEEKQIFEGMNAVLSPVVYMLNTMTAGASGGPWLWNDPNTEDWYVIGVNSAKNPGDPWWMQSPWLGHRDPILYSYKRAKVSATDASQYGFGSNTRPAHHCSRGVYQ